MPLQSSFNPTYVRRRMKLILRQQQNRLRMRMVGTSIMLAVKGRERRPDGHDAAGSVLQVAWGLVCIPLAPLLLTPIPNLPLYYAGYKVRTTLI